MWKWWVYWVLCEFCGRGGVTFSICLMPILIVWWKKKKEKNAACLFCFTGFFYLSVNLAWSGKLVTLLPNVILYFYSSHMILYEKFTFFFLLGQKSLQFACITWLVTYWMRLPGGNWLHCWKKKLSVGSTSHSFASSFKRLPVWCLWFLKVLLFPLCKHKCKE